MAGTGTSTVTGALTRAQVRRWLLVALGLPVVLAVAYVVQSVPLHSALHRVEAYGGWIESVDAPEWLNHLMGRDVRYCNSTPPPLPKLVLWLDDHYALRHRCAVDFNRDPGDAGLATLRDLPCTAVIQVPNSSVSDVGLSALRGLTKLEMLNLHGTRVVGPGLEHLRGLPALRILFLANTAVDDEGLALLDDLPSLRHLDLSHTRVRGPGLRALARFPALRSLKLAGTPVDDEGVAFLAGLPLTDLDLTNTSITAAGLASLRRIPGLSEVTLCGTQITEKAASRALRAHVTGCP